MSALPSKNILKIYEAKVGLYKGETPRITLETKRLQDTCFTAGQKITIKYIKDKITVILDVEGVRQITSRHGRQVLDIKSKDIQKAFNDISLVKIIVGSSSIEITPLKEALEQKRARDKIQTDKDSYDVVDMFCSGGTLAKCFYDNKKFNILAGIDYDDKKLANYQANFPDAEIWCGDISNVDWDRYKDAEIVDLTPSCRPFTEINKTGKKNEHAKEGDNTAHALIGIEKIRPAVILLEEVPAYQNSYSYLILKNVLQKMGYCIAEKILNAKDFGSLSYRKRFCMVASIKEGFSFLPIKPFSAKTVKDILEIPYEEREWKQLSKHEAWEKTQVGKGRNFKMDLIDENSISVRHPTTRYYDRQTSSFLINKNGRKDFLTPRELARVADLPDDFILPENKKDAVAIIGDGVVYSVFSYVVECIKIHLEAQISKDKKDKNDYGRE